MRKTLLTILLCVCSTLGLWAETSTVYTKVTGTPKNGWAGKYIIVYEKSATEAIVWDCTGTDQNFVTATIKDGVITKDFAEYQVEVKQETSSTYYIHTSEYRINAGSGNPDLYLDKNGTEFKIKAEAGFTKVTTKDGKREMLCNQTSEQKFRFRFFSENTLEQRKNICFYAVGEIEQGEAEGVLDINYAQADLYACPSKFPTNGDEFNQRFFTYLYLEQKESNDAVPLVKLELHAPTQYSIAGTFVHYINGATTESPIKYWINCEAGSKHSYIIFPSKEGGTQASIKTISLEMTPKGESTQPYAYVYHIKMNIKDSNSKNWTLDKDLDVFAYWYDCDRSGNKDKDMAPVPFVLESGTHGGQTGLDNGQLDNGHWTKILRNGQLYIMSEEKIYNIQGQEVQP